MSNKKKFSYLIQLSLIFEYNSITQKKALLHMSLNKSSLIESINFSPLNNSSSKAMYTFNKSSRFIENKQFSTSLYDKPSSLSKRATSFGYGVKSGLINKYMNTPSPDKYEKHSSFELTPKKGISIAMGRDDCKNVSIFNPNKYPAPTDYTSKSIKQSPAAYSIRLKLKLPELFPDKHTPGPDQYNNDSFHPDGLSLISKYRSSKSFKIHTRSSSSLDKTPPKALGPLTYNTVLPSTGKQILSKKRTEKSFYFDKKPRVTMQPETSSPGPGAYSTFSAFNR